jgi:hypothetical protein
VHDGSLGGTGLVKTLGGLTFSSAFDSANLKDVRWNATSSEHELFMANDCDGTPHQTRNSSWFYFSVRGLKPGQAISVRVMNSNRQPGLYRGGFKPVAKTLPSAPVWQRVASELVVCDEKREGGVASRFEIAFSVGLGTGAQPAGEVLFVAMTYPFGYATRARHPQSAVQEIVTVCVAVVSCVFYWHACSLPITTYASRHDSPPSSGLR